MKKECLHTAVLISILIFDKKKSRNRQTSLNGKASADTYCGLRHFSTLAISVMMSTASKFPLSSAYKSKGDKAEP